MLTNLQPYGVILLLSTISAGLIFFLPFFAKLYKGDGGLNMLPSVVIVFCAQCLLALPATVIVFYCYFVVIDQYNLPSIHPNMIALGISLMFNIFGACSMLILSRIGYIAHKMDVRYFEPIRTTDFLRNFVVTEIKEEKLTRSFKYQGYLAYNAVVCAENNTKLKILSLYVYLGSFDLIDDAGNKNSMLFDAQWTNTDEQKKGIPRGNSEINIEILISEYALSRRTFQNPLSFGYKFDETPYKSIPVHSNFGKLLRQIRPDLSHELFEVQVENHKNDAA